MAKRKLEMSEPKSTLLFPYFVLIRFISSCHKQRKRTHDVDCFIFKITLNGQAKIIVTYLFKSWKNGFIKNN